MDGLDSFELTPIHLSHQIDLRGKLGLVFIRRTDDGKTILARTSNYAAIDRPTPATIVNIDAALGLVLDIGIKREKQLTLGGGLYAPHDLEPPQSDRLVTQGDFDEALFDTITSSLNAQYQSGDLSREVSSIKANYLIEAYNSARLLYPRFHNESYLGLMRIVDGISQARRALEFALAAATVSPDLNTEISQKVSEVAGLAPRIQLAQEVFEEQLRSARGDMSLKMRSLEEHGRFIFACFYSAYRYRNKFVHHGFPFPYTVKESWDPTSGMAYLSSALGILQTRRHAPIGMGCEADYIDIHEALGDPDEVAEFSRKLFKLVPKWHFVKRFSREMLLAHIRSLAASLG